MGKNQQKQVKNEENLKNSINFKKGLGQNFLFDTNLLRAISNDGKVDKNDIVIKGLGFIKTNKKGIIKIYTLDGVEIFTRNSLI